MSPGRTYHHGDLRNALVEAALGQLAERDIEDVSLREVARAAGVSSGAPYHHFATRNDLLVAVAIEGFARLRAAIERAERGGSSPHDRMRRRLSAYLRFALEHGHHYRVMFHPLLRDAATHPELDATARAAFGGLVEAVAAVRPDVGPDAVRELALGAWSAAHGLVALHHVGADEVLLGRRSLARTIETSARQILALVEHG